MYLFTSQHAAAPPCSHTPAALMGDGGSKPFFNLRCTCMHTPGGYRPPETRPELCWPPTVMGCAVVPSLLYAAKKNGIEIESVPWGMKAILSAESSPHGCRGWRGFLRRRDPQPRGTWSASCTLADIPHSKAPSPRKTLHQPVPTVAATDLLVCSDQTLHFCSIRKNCLG